VDALLLLVNVSHFAAAPQQNLARLAEAEALAQRLPGAGGTPGGDRLRLARIHLGMGNAYTISGAVREAVDCYERALPVAQEFGDAEMAATHQGLLGQLKWLQGHFGEAGALLAQALPVLEKSGDWRQWITNKAFLGSSLATQGQYAAGLAEVQHALARAQELNSPGLIAVCHIYLADVFLKGGEWLRLLEAARAAKEGSEQAGDWLGVYLALGDLAFAESWLGRHAVALEYVAQQHHLAQRLGGRLISSGLFAAAHANIAFNAGRVEEALELAEQAAGLAQPVGSIWAEGYARCVWGQVLAALTPPRWDEAEAQLAESLRILELGEAWLLVAYAHVVWGSVCRDRGDVAAAREHWAKAAAQYEASGVAGALEQVRALMAES
jgi:tetratricopeptide (TPR) repeat protein